MQEEEVGGLQKRKKKNKIDEKLKKNKSSVVEELNEYRAKKIRVKSNEDKKKKYKGIDNVEYSVNDKGSRYSPNTDSNNVICRVKAVVETSKDDSKNAKEKGKRGGEVDKSYNGKKRFADDGKIREDENHSTGEDDVKVRKKVMNYKEAGKDDKDDSDVVASTKEDCVKERKALNDKDGNNKKNRSGKNMDNGKGEMRKVTNDKKQTRDKMRNDKKQTSGEGKKMVEHVEDCENGKHTESSLTHPVAAEPIHGRKEVEDSNVTRDKGCTTLNSKRKSRETKAVVVEVEKHGKKKSKKVKEQVGAIKHISKELSDEIFDIGEQKEYEEVEKVNVNDGELTVNKRKANADCSTRPSPKKKSKKVSFSGEVEVFPLSDDVELEENCEGNLIHGKRFSKKEDAMIFKSIENYIKAHGLGEEGMDMVMHSGSHPEVRGSWKEIGAALPWRPLSSITYRAHLLYERGKKRPWDPDELDLIKRFHKEHGSKWKALADVLGKHRHHVKDAWRRINQPNEKLGPWSQDEYQRLFDLVNLDLRMKAFADKKTKRGMLRDNIAWTAIGETIDRRFNFCCRMWYSQLASPMVAEGIWANSDDYKLLKALLEVDACCVEDVDWDNLLQHRSGEVCLKRWKQMTKYIGEYRDKPFPEQVELLSTRYDPSLSEVVQS